MAEFKKGDRVVFTKDTVGRGARGGLVALMPEGTLGTYDDAPGEGAPWVRLDTGRRVRAWASRIAPAEDHGTGDGSASDICAEPGCNCDLERRFPGPVVDDLWDAKDRVQREASAEVFAAPAPLDPSKVKPGDTVTLEKDGGKYEGAVAALTTDGMGRLMWVVMGGIQFHMEGPDAWTLIDHQPAPEPEPEWKPGDMAAVTARGWINAWSVRTATNDGWASHDNTDDVRRDDEVEAVRPLVVIDPADVDVVALQREIDDAMPGREASVALEHLGLNR